MPSKTRTTSRKKINTIKISNGHFNTCLRQVKLRPSDLVTKPPHQNSIPRGGPSQLFYGFRTTWKQESHSKESQTNAPKFFGLPRRENRESSTEHFDTYFRLRLGRAIQILTETTLSKFDPVRWSYQNIPGNSCQKLRPENPLTYADRVPCRPSPRATP